MKKGSYQERLNYLNSLGDELTPQLQDKIASLKASRQTTESLSKHDKVEVRARYILLRLDEMKEQGIPLQEIIEYLNILEEQGILTSKVRETMELLKRR